MKLQSVGQTFKTRGGALLRVNTIYDNDHCSCEVIEIGGTYKDGSFDEDDLTVGTYAYTRDGLFMGAELDADYHAHIADEPKQDAEGPQPADSEALAAMQEIQYAQDFKLMCLAIAPAVVKNNEFSSMIAAESMVEFATAMTKAMHDAARK
jgi:hypothetical protein